MNYQHNTSAGRITFYSGDSEFLFFAPSTINPSLKILENSMWFEKTATNGSTVYRSSSSVESLEWLRDNIGPLTLSKEVYTWYKDVSNVAPIYKVQNSPALDYQREAISFLVSRTKAMLSLSPGLGKTLVSILAANEIEAKRVLVVAPLSLLYMWKSELEKWGEYLKLKPLIYVWHKKSLNVFDLKSPESIWMITNPQTITRNDPNSMNIIKAELLILDESILYKNRKAQRTKKIRRTSQKNPENLALNGSTSNQNAG